MVIRVGMIGLSEGNGHPFSMSAIINGYSDTGLAESGWPVIHEYVKRRHPSEFDARARPRPPLGPRRLAKRGDAARDVHAQSRLHDEGRRAARPDQFHADPERSDANPSGIGQIAFDRLQLDPLAAFGAHLPLPARIRADLARFAPRGTLTQGRLEWEGPAESPTAYSASAEFTKLGMIAQDALPGATGISGRFDMTQDRGDVKMASSNAVLDLPRVFRAPIALDTVQGAVKWERRAGTTTIRVEQLEFANADVAGSASGTYRTAARGPGEIDFVANATRGDARQVDRYLPRSSTMPRATGCTGRLSAAWRPRRA